MVEIVDNVSDMASSRADAMVPGLGSLNSRLAAGGDMMVVMVCQMTLEVVPTSV